MIYGGNFKKKCDGSIMEQQRHESHWYESFQARVGEGITTLEKIGVLKEVRNGIQWEKNGVELEVRGQSEWHI